MKLLTKETDYAIRAVMYVARRDGFVSSRDIAGQEEIPLHFLRRILQNLVRVGIIESKEGVSGGVRLTSRPDAIRVADLVRIFQGRIQLSECMFRRKICSNRRTCVLRKRIQTIEEMVTEEFENMTIADLLQDVEVQYET